MDRLLLLKVVTLAFAFGCLVGLVVGSRLGYRAGAIDTIRGEATAVLVEQGDGTWDWQVKQRDERGARP